MRRVMFALVCAGSLLGCSHGQQAAPVENLDLGGGVSETVSGDEVKKAYDTNGDRKPDAFEIYKRAKDPKGKGSDALVRKEFDHNFDGKIDHWRFYDEKGELEHESFDFDFDGKVDAITYFVKGQRVKEERDFDASNQPHTWLYYERNQLARKERDTRKSGKPDYYEFWENGQVDRIGLDRDGDGKIEFWEKNPDTQSAEAAK